jgi:protein TonB
MGIQGKVYVSFFIEKDGTISDVNVIRGVHKSLDKEAIRVVKSIPKLKPGLQKGKKVKVKYTLPINFRLG